MSDVTTVEAPEVEEADKPEKDTGSVDMGGYKLKLCKIEDGKNKGALFWVKQYKTLDDAISHLTELSKSGKKGSEIALNLLNSALSFRLRGKAVSKLTWVAKEGSTVAEKTEFLTKVAARIKAEENIVTSDEARDYIPGEREVDALSGFLRQKDGLAKAIKEAKAKGDIETLKTQILKYKEVVELIKKKQEEEEADILASLD